MGHRVQYRVHPSADVNMTIWPAVTLPPDAVVSWPANMKVSTSSYLSNSCTSPFSSFKKFNHLCCVHIINYTFAERKISKKSLNFLVVWNSGGVHIDQRKWRNWWPAAVLKHIQSKKCSGLLTRKLLHVLLDIIHIIIHCTHTHTHTHTHFKPIH